MHTCINYTHAHTTYATTNIQTYEHTNIQTDITHIHALHVQTIDMHEMHAYTHTRTHAHTHTHAHTYTHTHRHPSNMRMTYTQTCIHRYMALRDTKLRHNTQQNAAPQDNTCMQKRTTHATAILTHARTQACNTYKRTCTHATTHALHHITILCIRCNTYVHTHMHPYTCANMHA